MPKDVYQHTFIALTMVAIIAIASDAYSYVNYYDFPGDAPGYYNDHRIAEAINRIFAYLEGSFGALIMVAAGIMAIVSAAFGNYRASLGLLIVAIGPFILRSFVATFFNDENIQ